MVLPEPFPGGALVEILVFPHSTPKGFNRFPILLVEGAIRKCGLYQKQT
jgi:hypothetical protein